MTQSLLDDPTYRPQHPPVAGQVPDVVAKWGPRSQLRWFDRYRDELAARPATYWARFYCSSTQHTGHCCWSCGDDRATGFDDLGSEWCCCYAMGGEQA